MVGIGIGHVLFGSILGSLVVFKLSFVYVVIFLCSCMGCGLGGS